MSVPLQHKRAPVGTGLLQPLEPARATTCLHVLFASMSRHAASPRPPQGWKGIVSSQAPHSTAAVAAMCMLVMELTRVLPEWNNWL